MAIRLSNAAASAAADAVTALIDGGPAGGKIKIRTGAQPANADDASTGTVLAVLTFADPAFPGAAVNGVDTSAAITQDSSADATGAAGHFEVTDSNDAVVFRGTVTQTGGGGDMELVTTSITAGQPVQVTSFTYTQPKQ